MKTKLILLSFFVLLIIGCKENNSIVEPNNDQQVLDKSVSTYTSDSYLIDGSIGGKINVEYNWKNAHGEKSKVIAELKIPKNAFSGIKEFSMIFNLSKFSVDLFPSPTTFDKPIILNLKYKNINVLDKDLDFKYLDGNEVVVYDENIVDLENGTLEVKKARLNHFSEWGWGR
ncbi:MAG: hypothetical protein HYS24_10145 [Ignavibacteriales bacterium]|nr:hypothetical protein [Ignavibacteriales bacterium]